MIHELLPDDFKINFLEISPNIDIFVKFMNLITFCTMTKARKNKSAKTDIAAIS